MDSATTLVHAFVSLRVDYCNILFASAPKVVTDRLQRVLHAASRVVSSTHKYDRGFPRLLHTELHWLDVPEKVKYKLGVAMYSCLNDQSPRYLADLVPVSATSQQGSIFDPLLGVSWCFRDVGSAHSVHGPSLWPASRF